MGANIVGQVRPTLGASIRTVTEQARKEFALSEALGARRALHDVVVPAVLKEKRTLFAAEATRQATVEVDHPLAVAFDGVLGRDRL